MLMHMMMMMMMIKSNLPSLLMFLPASSPKCPSTRTYFLSLSLKVFICYCLVAIFKPTGNCHHDCIDSFYHHHHGHHNDLFWGQDHGGPNQQGLLITPEQLLNLLFDQSTKTSWLTGMATITILFVGRQTVLSMKSWLSRDSAADWNAHCVTGSWRREIFIVGSSQGGWSYSLSYMPYESSEDPWRPRCSETK